MKHTPLHDRLKKDVIDSLKKELGVTNVHALPRIQKVVVSTGINKSKMDSKEMHAYIEETLANITGQKPVFTKARKAISNFKTRTGMTVGAMVTLRGKKMADFLDRLISYALPRIRDFRGLNTNLDGHGNYSIGLRDHSIFPEVAPPDAKQIFGLQIQITTTAENDYDARTLLKLINVPFRPEKKEEAAVDKTEKAPATEEKPAPAEANEAEETPEKVEEEVASADENNDNDAPSEAQDETEAPEEDKPET